jgi:hypothetical protein
LLRLGHSQIEAVGEAIPGSAGVLQRPALSAAGIIPGVKLGLKIVADEVVVVALAIQRLADVEVSGRPAQQSRQSAAGIPAGIGCVVRVGDRNRRCRQDGNATEREKHKPGAKLHSSLLVE